MRPVSLCAVFVLVLAFGAVGRAEPVAAPTYAELRKAQPDGRSVPVHGLVLERDVFHLRFDSGAFHFLAPVEGRTVGAVFVGQGSLKLIPATPAESRQLALASGGDKRFETLTEEFDEMVLLFADDTAAEIQLHAPVQTGAPDPRALQAWEAHLKRQRKEFKTNFHIRILQDLLNTPGLTSGVFLAFLDGRKYPPALAAVDPYGAESLRLAIRLGGEDSVFFVADESRGGVWYLCDQKSEVERKRAMPEKRLTEALHYKVETAVARNADITGTTTIRFQPLVAGLRVLPVHLLPKLRVSEALYTLDGTEPAWKPAAVIQEDDEEDGDAAVVLPEALPKGATALLRLAYQGGEVLKHAGARNFVVGARASWYPNLGVFSDPATFELVYRIPLGNEIVSVGRQVESRTEEKQSVSVWKTDQPVQVAGFNYGKFKKVEQTDETSSLEVEVYTNPGTPDFIREINEALSACACEGTDGPTLGTVSTSRLAESALVDGVNSARIFTTYFGPLPVRHVAITQQPEWVTGQSWPSLIYLPYLSFLTPTQRREVLGIREPGVEDWMDRVGYHEVAHQWWGHLVGAATYRDAWLEEGFADFSAGLAVQHTQGWEEHDRFWRERRKEILERLPGNAVASNEAGPITQGWRLSTQRSPSAGGAVRSKGGYVLHMLRMMMWDGSSQTPDARFIAMMQDFTKAYGGKLATTADFQRVAEKHMNGPMDWFFGQWVYGTEIPKYRHNLRVEKGEQGKYRISGTVTQLGVSSDFRALVPIYVEFNKTERARVALLPIVGVATTPVDFQIRLPKEPRRALMNARGDVLTREVKEEAARIAGEIAPRLAALGADFGQKRRSVLQPTAALLSHTEATLLEILSYPELAPMRDAVSEELRLARDEVRESRSGIPRLTVVPAAFRQPSSSPGNSALERVERLIARLASLAEKRELVRDLCVVSQPRSRARVLLYPPSYPRDKQETHTSGKITLFLGLYAYEAQLGGDPWIRCVPDQEGRAPRGCAFLDLLSNTQPIVSCDFSLGSCVLQSGVAQEAECP